MFKKNYMNIKKFFKKNEIFLKLFKKNEKNYFFLLSKLVISAKSFLAKPVLK